MIDLFGDVPEPVKPPKRRTVREIREAAPAVVDRTANMDETAKAIKVLHEAGMLAPEEIEKYKLIL